MELSWTEVALWPLLSTVVCLWCAVVSWLNRRVTVARYMALFSVGVTVWSIGYTFELCSVNYGTALFWANFQYLGILLVPPTMYHVARRLADYPPRRDWAIFAYLYAMPIATLAVLWADPWLGWFRTDAYLDTLGGNLVLVVRRGPWFLLHVAWAYSLLVISAVWLWRARRQPGLLGKQATMLLAALLVSFAGNLAYVLGLTPEPFIDPTPGLFTISGLAIVFAVLRWSFVRLLPMARERIFDEIPDPVLVLDMHEHVVDMNAAAVHVGLSAALGRNISAALGRNISAAFDEDSVRAIRNQGTVLREGREFEIRHSELTDSFGDPVGVLVRAIDVTELRRATRVLREASDAKSRFLANMSHELRTPINGIIGLTELLNEAQLGPTEREYVGSILNCSESLLELVSDILDLGRLQEGQMPIMPVPADLGRLVQGLATTYDTLARRKGLKFEKIVPKGLGWVSVDAGRLRQILHNLLGNALKFTENGTVCLEVRQEEGTHIFAVHDTGIGIPISQQERIFQRFEQLHTGGDRAYGGTGLGLAITRQLVQAMGGRVTIDSAEGKGSTFTVELPLLPAVRPQAPLAGEGISPGIRVLVAEDNPVNSTVVSRHLDSLGCHVVLARDGEEAVARCRDAEFDLVLMDVHMPVMDGLRASRTIRDLGIRQPRIVALTAAAFPEERRRCEESGMDGFLTKPVRKSDLAVLIGSIRKA